MQVDAVAKRPLRAGDPVDVKYPAATEPVPIALNPGDPTFLFLVLFPNTQASLVNPMQGSYLLEDGETIQAADGNPVQFSEEFLTRMGVSS